MLVCVVGTCACASLWAVPACGLPTTTVVGLHRVHRGRVHRCGPCPRAVSRQQQQRPRPPHLSLPGTGMGPWRRRWSPAQVPPGCRTAHCWRRRGRRRRGTRGGPRRTLSAPERGRWELRPLPRTRHGVVRQGARCPHLTNCSNKTHQSTKHINHRRMGSLARRMCGWLAPSLHVYVTIHDRGASPPSPQSLMAPLSNSIDSSKVGSQA